MGGMCGRFSLTASRDEIEALFGAMIAEDFPPRYNIAPTQPILAILASETPRPGSNHPNRIGVLARWGFIPSWVKQPGEWPLVFNIRSESAAEKKSFRAALTHRRALVPVSGFYEWRRVGKNKSQPYWITPSEGGTMALGALVETWSNADGSQIDTVGLLTTNAENELRSIHERMPVVVQPQDYERWLNCKDVLAREVQDVMSPTQKGFFEVVPVSDKVNKVSNTSPDLQTRVEECLTEPEQPTKTNKLGPKDDSTDQLSLF